MDENSERRGSPGASGYGLATGGWALLVALLVFGGLLLSARAGDDYMAASGLLFAGFGMFLGYRLLHRSLP
ncbi:hypothetical protein [Sabulicella glaciei]|uniref:Uncharacterized protein n=1 Tax=Sabulicella glaciei TaxID=2984948 RepID=A0ABT3NYD3_9PROT|nr:hypothetical protein [Roseococcus sp. MDT2-1-1]MCW8086574.1 hypothetical protein [Roseococcus sp. MDT2-1-1]